MVGKKGVVNGARKQNGMGGRSGERSVGMLRGVSLSITQPLFDSAAQTRSDAQAGCFKSDRMIHAKQTEDYSIEARLQNIQIPSDLDKFSWPFIRLKTHKTLVYSFIYSLKPPPPKTNPPTRRRNCREIRETCSNLFRQVKNGNEQKNHCRRRNLHSNLCSRSEGLWAESAHVVYSPTSDKPGRIKLRQRLIYVRHTQTHTLPSSLWHKQFFIYIYIYKSAFNTGLQHPCRSGHWAPWR